MSQRNSGYERKAFDLYETPEWVTQALVWHIPPRVEKVLEPAAGSGKMASALMQGGFVVEQHDIQDGNDFLSQSHAQCDAIITNPPYNFAAEFIRHSLELTRARQGVVAMLLRTDFDHAKTRANLFGRHPAFAKKLVLTKRIVWFQDERKAAPSYNHAWFLWDWKNKSSPVIAYDIQDAA